MYTFSYRAAGRPVGRLGAWAGAVGAGVAGARGAGEGAWVLAPRPPSCLLGSRAGRLGARAGVAGVAGAGGAGEGDWVLAPRSPSCLLGRPAGCLGASPGVGATGCRGGKGGQGRAAARPARLVRVVVARLLLRGLALFPFWQGQGQGDAGQ